MSRRRRSPPKFSERPKPPLIRVPTPPFGTLAADRDRAAALLELARARHYLDRLGKRTRVQGDSIEGRRAPLAAGQWEKRLKGRLAAASILGEAPGPIMASALNELGALERAGAITPSESNAAMDNITRYLTRWNRIEGAPNMSSDLPPELAESADGVSDDGAYDASIIGAGPLQAEIVGCGLDGIQGLPWYNLQRPSVPTAIARRRFLAALSKLPPKARRRVLAKLRAVSAANAVSGAIRAATPSIAGSGAGWSLVSGPSIAIGGGRSRCPYANVAGPLTP